MNSFLRQYVIPALILLVFGFTLVVVSIRSFLPDDMAAPAPVAVVPGDLATVSVTLELGR